MLPRTITILAILLTLPLHAETLLERLKTQLHEAAAEARQDAPPLKRLEEAATDVETMVGRVERHVDASVQFLRDIGPCGQSSSAPATTTAPHDDLEQIPAELDRAFDELQASRNEVENLVKPQSPPKFREAVRQALATADEMLTRRRDSSIAARWLRRFADERRRAESHQELCRLLESVAPLPEPFTIADVRRDPLVPLRRLDDAVRTQVLRRNTAMGRGEWSLGLGAMWTPMKALENGRQRTRAGQPLAMIGFRPLPEDLPIFRNAPIRPWVQIGTGLEFDHPSFYVGGAIDMGPYVLAGVGWTAQQVEDENGDDEFDGDVYVSMTIRLDRLHRWMHGE